MHKVIIPCFAIFNGRRVKTYTSPSLFLIKPYTNPFPYSNLLFFVGKYSFPFMCSDCWKQARKFKYLPSVSIDVMGSKEATLAQLKATKLCSIFKVESQFEFLNTFKVFNFHPIQIESIFIFMETL